ncbi:MAG: hypothetical protein ACYC0N_00800 [Carboxydocellales bacterium]
MFASLGFNILFYPERSQKRAIDLYNRNKTAAKLNPFLGWMKTKQYIWTLRIIGVVALVVSILLLFALVIIVLESIGIS